MCEVKYNVNIDTYKERLEERIIAYLSEINGIPLDEAMDPGATLMRVARIIPQLIKY